jgi:hypothetical protein
MNTEKHPFTGTLLCMAAAMALLTLCMALPFLPGEYDRLAMPLSLMAQVFGLAGLPFACIGLGWLLLPKKRMGFALAALVWGVVVWFLLVLVAWQTAGIAFGVISLVAGLFFFHHLKSRWKRLKNAAQPGFQSTPLYLLALPLFTLLLQWQLAKPLTQWSRKRVMENAGEYIAALETYHEKHGRYPSTLQAMHRDYYPETAGVEKYHYSPHGSSYNLSFEQPRFFLDDWGAREWVVYNPREEQRAYSHTSWFLLLLPEELERSQGWYAADEVGRAHWKRFLFD